MTNKVKGVLASTVYGIVNRIARHSPEYQELAKHATQKELDLSTLEEMVIETEEGLAQMSDLLRKQKILGILAVVIEKKYNEELAKQTEKRIAKQKDLDEAKKQLSELNYALYRDQREIMDGLRGKIAEKDEMITAALTLPKCSIWDSIRVIPKDSARFVTDKRGNVLWNKNYASAAI